MAFTPPEVVEVIAGGTISFEVSLSFDEAPIHPVEAMWTATNTEFGLVGGTFIEVYRGRVFGLLTCLELQLAVVVVGFQV